MVASRESLLTASAVKLYGRVIAGLSVNVANARNELGANMFLRQQLEAAEPQLARIYGFSYHGSYTALSRPPSFSSTATASRPASAIQTPRNRSI